jgi:hypothetical protein
MLQELTAFMLEIIKLRLCKGTHAQMRTQNFDSEDFRYGIILVPWFNGSKPKVGIVVSHDTHEVTP